MLQGIAALGFSIPTPVQQLVIPAVLEVDLDVVALAQTGTGKTAAFGLPLLHRLGKKHKGVQALVLCPTRELCLQVAGELGLYSQFSQSVNIVPVYGGASIEGQIRAIKAGAQVIVATPGRLLDLINRKVLQLDLVERVVLDEADEMLNMGFKEDLDLILSNVTSRKSIWLFSATMPQEVRAISKNYMNSPKELRVDNFEQGQKNIQHEYYVCHSENRYAALKRLVDANPGIYGLIFCRTKAETKEVAEQMTRDGYNADALHGDLSQHERDRVMNRFRERSLQLLIATDVAARGIDVSDITHVINYGLPDEPEVYTHRSGRTGRAGKQGVSMVITTPKFVGNIQHLERKNKVKLERKDIPSGKEVCENQLFHIVQNIREQEIHQKEIEPFLPKILESLKDLSKEELITRFASTEFNRFLSYYRNARDINYSTAKRKQEDGGGMKPGRSGGRMEALFLGAGDKDGVNKKVLLKILKKELRVPEQAIGDVVVKNSFAVFAINAELADRVQKELREYEIDGQAIRVNSANEKQMKMLRYRK